MENNTYESLGGILYLHDLDCVDEDSSSTPKEVEAKNPAQEPSVQQIDVTRDQEVGTDPVYIEHRWIEKWNILGFLVHKVPKYVKMGLSYVVARWYYLTTPRYILSVDPQNNTRRWNKMAMCEVKSGYRRDPLKITDRDRRQDTRKHIHIYLNNPLRRVKRAIYEWLNK